MTILETMWRVPYTDRNLEQNRPRASDRWPTNLRTNCSIHRWKFGTKRSEIINWEQCVPFTDKNTEQTVIIGQLGNNVFHLHIRTWNKTVLIYQFGNNVSHLKMGTRNKTVLDDQFGNNEFLSQTGTRNRTVPICQSKTICSIYSWAPGAKFSSFILEWAS